MVCQAAVLGVQIVLRRATVLRDFWRLLDYYRLLFGAFLLLLGFLLLLLSTHISVERYRNTARCRCVKRVSVYKPGEKALPLPQPVLFLWTPLGLLLATAARVGELRVLRGLWLDWRKGLELTVKCKLRRIAQVLPLSLYLSGCTECRHYFSVFLI